MSGYTRSARPRWATHLITSLDVVVIVLAATGVVMALGADYPFSLGAMPVLLRDPLRPLLLAGIAGVIRWAIGRTQPLLPSLSMAVHPHMEAERVHIAAPIAATRDVKYYALAAVLGSLVWLTPHLVKIRHVPDPGDPIFSAWRLARFTRQLTHEPAMLFDGNIFHPARNTLTYSDPTVLQGVAAFPFIALGADPLVVSNALFLASFPLCALAFFYTAWRLTADAQAACVAGILGGLSTFKIAHYSHLELQFLCFAPLAILTLLRLVAAPSWRTGAAFGATVTAQWLACMYLGVMLWMFLAPIVLVAFAAFGLRSSRHLTVALATSAVIIVAGGSLTAVPFLRSQPDRGDRSMDDVRFYSATPGSYAARHENLATYRNIRSRVAVVGGSSVRDLLKAPPRLPERQLFPGALPLILGAVGMAPPASLGTIALMAGTAVAFDGSLGTNGLIYDELYNYTLPFRGLRVPARFAALAGTGLILLSAYGARRVLSLGRTRATRALIFGALGAGALIDVRPGLWLEPYHDVIPPIYAAVTDDMVLAELPMVEQANFAYMYFSTFHWARLINGQSGHMPVSHKRLQEEMAFFPTGHLLQRLRERGTTHITVNCKLFPEPEKCATLLERMDEMPELGRVSSAEWQGAEVRLYALR